MTCPLTYWNSVYNKAVEAFFNEASPKPERTKARVKMDRFELRRLDYSLSSDHVDLQSSYRKFFETHCPIDTVRAAEATGFDKGIWERLCAMGASSMPLSESVNGDGATLVDLSLVAEEIGRSMAPVPWIDHVCAVRLLVSLGRFTEIDCAQAIVEGRRLLTMDTRVHPGAEPALISSAAIADHVIVRDGPDIVLLTFDPRPVKVDNIAHLPMAWVDPSQADGRTVLGTGPDAAAKYRRALDEWRLLTAAALVGLLDQTMWIAVEFAKTRTTLGVSIGTLQAISHALANIAIAVESGRNLVHRAAWFVDNDPDQSRGLAPSAFLFMAEEAAKGATMAVHVQGGLGVSNEAPAAAYLVRARGWPLAGGDPAASALDIARRMAASETSEGHN